MQEVPESLLSVATIRLLSPASNLQFGKNNAGNSEGVSHCLEIIDWFACSGIGNKGFAMTGNDHYGFDSTTKRI